MTNIKYYVKKCKNLLNEAEMLGNTLGEQINEVKNGYLDDILREYNDLKGALQSKDQTIALQQRIIELMAEGISDVQIRHVRFYELSPLIKAQQEIINYYTNKAKEETNA